MLRLRFAKHVYGPYADNLHKVLELLEGHYLRGATDRSPMTEIQLLADAGDRARAFLATDSEGAGCIDIPVRILCAPWLDDGVDDDDACKKVER